jgi:hypothetical protein
MSVEEYARTEDRVWIAKGTSVIDEGLGAETRATLQRLSEPEMVKQNRARFNSFGRQINLQNTQYPMWPLFPILHEEPLILPMIWKVMRVKLPRIASKILGFPPKLLPAKPALPA